MSDAFTDGFCIKLVPYFEQEQVRQIRDLLNIYSMGYTITPITTELSVAGYQLPQAYFVFMAAKEQDGKMSEKSKEQYRMCLEDLLFFLKMPVESVQAVLGHSEISTTMRYAHVANDKVKADHQKYMQ